jgi:fused signal recognition particle receptor
MFKFLKKRLKKFEDKLEEELEQEIKKDTGIDTQKQDQKPEVDEEVKPSSQEPEITEPLKPEVEQKPSTEEKKEPSTPKPLTPRERRRRRREAKKQRDEKTDKQIEETLKAELERTYQTRKSISKSIQKDTSSGRKISEEKLDDLLWELEIGLLESDVAYDVIESIKKDIKEELRKVPLKRGSVNETVERVLRHAISHVLESNKFNFEDFIEEKEKPIVIMFVGVNGSGKTLSIAKMATLLQEKGYSSVMAAGDTFRAGAIEQLGIHADKIGVKIVKHGPGADPAAVAYDAIEHAKAKHKEVVLLDTAGRMQTNVNLMDEMAKIKRVAKPDLILFVGDALAGNDAVEQAKRFNEIVGIDGVILTKVDTDAKGGSALSVAYTIGKPLLFIGVGQEYDEQIPFDAQWMIDNIFGK